MELISPEAALEKQVDCVFFLSAPTLPSAGLCLPLIKKRNTNNRLKCRFQNKKMLLPILNGIKTEHPCPHLLKKCSIRHA